MGKLEDFIDSYSKQSGIVLEAEDTGTITSGDTAATDVPVDQPVDPNAMATAAPTPEVKDLTTVGYANAVKDMIAMLDLGLRSPEDFRLDDRVVEIIDTQLEPGDPEGGVDGNVQATHELIRNLIRDLGSEID